MEEENAWAFLPWDSAHFGCRIARLMPSSVTRDTMVECLKWCRQEKIDCLYWLLPTDHAQATAIAERNDFNLIDCRVTLEHQVLPPEKYERSICDAATINDIHALKAIAKVSHTDSRFYYDDHFSREQCGNLYEIWIEKAVHDPRGVVLVAKISGRPVGYISCQITGGNSEPQGQIGLIAVAADAQGKGLGRNLLDSALYWFAERGVKTVQVVTQGRNIRATRMYERSAFLTKTLQLWYHRWFVEG
jgi:ribosomal protein S18 acetylase RimI-like enzyme